MKRATGDPPLAAPDWTTCFRLIPTRFPTVGLYDAIADPADLDTVFAIEALTNPRIRDELGRMQLVPPEDRISGPGSSLVMAAFTHLNPEGSRFSDGNFGVYYAAESVETAVAEVGHHRAVFLARTAEPAIDIDLRLISAPVVAEPWHDLRGRDPARDAVYAPHDYTASRALGLRLRAAESLGVIYHSVRLPGGQCLGAFKPRALGSARPMSHVAMHWDGQRITHWFEKRDPRPLPVGSGFNQS